jgi:N-acetylneuraminic acid mutarotase
VIYAIGGYTGSFETDNEAYDPVSNSWSTKAPMPTGRKGLAAAVVDGLIYAIGGDSGAPLTANEAYNPVANSWNTKTPLTTGRTRLAAVAVDGVIYAIGGETSSTAYETINDAYTPALYVYSKD